VALNTLKDGLSLFIITTMEIADSLLKSLADNNPGNFALYRLHEGRLIALFHSASLPRLSGMKEEEYESRVASDAAAIVFPEDKPRVASALAAILKTHEDIDVTYRILHASSGTVWVHARGRYIGEKDGDPVLNVIFQETSGESEELATILGNSMTQVYVLDASDHQLLFANARALKVWGKTQYSGLKRLQAVNGLDTPCPWCPIAQMEKGSFHEHNFYSPITRQWYDLTLHEMDWHGRKAIAVYRRDITPEKERQAQAEFDKQSLETIVNNLPVGVAACEVKDGAILTLAVNARLQDLLGLSEKDLILPHPDLLSHVNPLDRSIFFHSFSAIRDGDKALCFEFRYTKAPQFREVWIHCESTCLLSNGRKFIFLSLADFTEQKEAELEAVRRKAIYEAAVEKAHLSAWEYYPKERRVVTADNPTTKANPLVTPSLEETGRFPDILFPNVREDSLADFQAIFRAIDEGKASVSADIWFKENGKMPEHCERISYTSIFGDDGSVIKAVGIEQDVTAEKMAEKKYEQAFAQLEESRPNTLGSFRMDLNENRVLESRSAYPNILRMSADGSADSLFENFAQMHSDSAMAKEIQKELTRKGLIDAYATGRTKFGFVHRFQFPDGSFHWLESSLYLLENPKNNHLEGLAFAYIVDERKKMEDVIAHLTSKHFDYIGILHLNEKTIEFITKAPFIAFEPAKSFPYETWRNYIRTNTLMPAAVPGYNDASSLEKIKEGLLSRGEYSFVSYQKIDGKKAIGKANSAGSTRRVAMS
jgi:PAS domain-containing protein